MKYLLALLLVALAALEFFYHLSAAPAPELSAPADTPPHLHGHH